MYTALSDADKETSISQSIKHRIEHVGVGYRYSDPK